MVKDYEAVSQAVQELLTDYLEDNGINTKKHFHCIHPDHDDNNPSCHLMPSGKVFHCYSCGFSGTIFHAAHFLENKPIVGKAFITDNLTYLAHRYGIEIETQPLTDEQIYELDTYRVYKMASDLVTYTPHADMFLKAIQERGWDEEICETFGVGSVVEYKDFRESLKKVGFSASFLDDVDLSRREIFGNDCLIFSIKDEHGRPVGFAARNLAWKEGDQRHKYNNQKCTGVKCNIYKRSQRLYGIHAVPKKEHNLILVEGYADVLTMASNGIKNVAAICGLAVTEEQVRLIKRQGFSEVTLCLDGDRRGKDATAKLLDGIFSEHKEIVVKIINLPMDTDPDELIREKGVETLKSLRVWGAFEWRLEQFDDAEDPTRICDLMIPLIAAEPSYVGQEALCKTLAANTGVDLRSIQNELERLQNQQESHRAQEEKEVLSAMVYDLKKTPEQAQDILYATQEELFTIATRYDEDKFSTDSTLSLVRTQKVTEEQKDGSFSGYTLGPDLEIMQNCLGGDWKHDVWLTLGGKPNSGKTSFSVKLAVEIATYHEQNNCVVIYHTIDDTNEQVLPKFVSCCNNSHEISLNQIMDPNFHQRVAGSTTKGELIHKHREDGYDKLTKLVESGHLVLKDMNDGVSFAYIDKLIRYYKNKYPERNIFYVLDNFHKLNELNSVVDERVKNKMKSSIIKGLATKHHITILTTVEYRKVQTGKKGNNSDIAETGQIEYDANIIMHLHNDYHDLRENCSPAMLHIAKDPEREEPVACPVVELMFGKNKVTGFKGNLYYNFYPFASDFVNVENSVILSKKQDANEQQTKTKVRKRNSEFEHGAPFG